MDFFAFEHALLRLKEALGVRTDKEVAEFLGLDVSALNKRKARGSFPEKELRALAAERPELNVDLEYVVTGKAQHERAVELAASTAASGVKALRSLGVDQPITAPAAPTRADLARGTGLDPAWPMVLELVYDTLLAHKRQMPNGKQLRELVDAVLVVLRLDEEGELDNEKLRRKIEAMV